MKKGLFLSLLLIGFTTLLLSCGSSLQNAGDIDKALDALEQTVQESEKISKDIANGDFEAITKVAELAVKYQEHYTALQGAESKMTPEQKERLESLIKRFNAEGDTVGEGEGEENDFGLDEITVEDEPEAVEEEQN